MMCHYSCIEIHFVLAYKTDSTDISCVRTCSCLNVADDTFKHRQAERLAREQIQQDFQKDTLR